MLVETLKRVTRWSCYSN